MRLREIGLQWKRGNIDILAKETRSGSNSYNKDSFQKLLKCTGGVNEKETIDIILEYHIFCFAEYFITNILN